MSLTRDEQNLMASKPEVITAVTEFTFGDWAEGLPTQVCWRGEGSWAVKRGALVWSSEAINPGWIYEPSPSNRDGEFLAITRFSLAEALRIAREETDHGPTH